VPKRKPRQTMNDLTGRRKKSALTGVRKKEESDPGRSGFNLQKKEKKSHPPRGGKGGRKESLGRLSLP